ncbi:MAG: hypothetical protein SVS15_05205 [Thermodesulfobacteriota bacterium]|nr:hypothetical protein [Thermodesulfobacteriota bacterium]
MKLYFIILSVLFLTRVLLSVWFLLSLPHYLVFLNHVGDIVLFTLCWAGALDLAFKKRLLNFSPDKWRLTYQATLVLGAGSVLLTKYGADLGVPSPAGSPGILTLGLIFLPYVLFAIPVIVHEHELKKE